MLKEAAKQCVVVHTMTVTLPQDDCRIEMQFFHALVTRTESKLIGRRMRMIRNTTSCFKRDRMKMKRLMMRRPPNNMRELEALIRNKNARVEHRLKTIPMVGPLLIQQSYNEKETPEKCPSPTNQHRTSPILTTAAADNSQLVTETNEDDFDQLVLNSTPEQTSDWLLKNRFGNYRDTFASFSGADMLRMSREDLIQICGQVDGIRLYNSIHLKTISPKLKIYVCREHTSIFNAVFLLSYNNVELVQKLCPIFGIEQEQVMDIYMEGPHSIRVQVSSDVIRHISEETMFAVEVLKDHGRYALLLKRSIK